MRLSTSALTICASALGEKRQSVVKLTTWKRMPRHLEGPRQSPRARGGGIEIVQRARDQQVGVGVEVLAELVALVAQVALDLELDVLGGVAQFGRAQSRPNFSSIESSDR